MYREPLSLAASTAAKPDLRLAPAALRKRRGAWSLKVVIDIARGFWLLAAILASLAAISIACDALEIGQAATREITALLPVFAAILFFALPAADRSPLTAMRPADVAAMALVVACAIGGSVVAHAAIGFREFMNWQIFVLWFAAGASSATAARALTSMVLRTRVISERLQRRIAIYGAGEQAVRVHDALFSTQREARLIGFFDDRHRSGRLKRNAPAVRGSLDDLIALLRRGDVDEVVIALPRTAAARVETIAEKLHDFPVDLHVCTHFADDFPIISGARDVSRVGDAGLLQLHRRPIRGWGVVLKRLEDIVLGSIFLMLLAPVMALVALAIRLDSAGPVIFRQKRHGLVNEPITVFKFRSMSVEENGPALAQASRNDPRITRVGAFIRSTSLDELPQLINVIRGEMSLVGPRPHAIAHNNLYGATIDRYYGRHAVRPGITGWAQINGYRGETRDSGLMVKRVEHDLWYIQNWSLWMDLKIILMTPFRGLIHKNAY